MSVQDATKHNQETKAGAKGAAPYKGGASRYGLRLLAVLACAIAQPLLSAPFSWWPLHWFSWVPFLWAIHEQDGRGRLALAWLGGTVSNFLIFYWIVNLMPNFSNIPTHVSIFLNYLLCGALAFLWVLLAALIPPLRRRYPRAWVLLAPALLVFIEFFLPQLFPYMQGVSHYQVVPIIQLSSITGIYGVSFLLFWSNCILFELWQAKREGRPLPVWHMLAFFLVLDLTIGYGLQRKARYETLAKRARTLKVGLIQANLRPYDHRKLGFVKVQNLYEKMSKEAAKRGAQWIVWSEGEFKYPLSNRYARRILRITAERVGRPLLIGGIDLKRAGKRYLAFNSALHVTPEGLFSPRYDKNILVPFGEYMPYEKQLSPIYSKISWQSRYSRGKGPLIQTLDKIPYSYLICYEAIYPAFVRQAVRQGSRLLVNITYDAWFGRTTAPYQHQMLAVIRSAELGVPLIRLSTSGVTTTADALGRMQAQSPIFVRRVIIQDVRLVYMPTLYSKIGDLFSWICTISFLIALIPLLTNKKP